MRLALPIHASDTASAALGGLLGETSKRTSIMLTAISGTNTVLALLARRTLTMSRRLEASRRRGLELRRPVTRLARVEADAVLADGDEPAVRDEHRCDDRARDSA